MDITHPLSANFRTGNTDVVVTIPQYIDTQNIHRNSVDAEAQSLHWWFTTEYVHDSANIRRVVLDSNFEINSVIVKVFHEPEEHCIFLKSL